MVRKSIAIDLDDVIASHAEAFIEFSNIRYGTSLSIEDYSERWDNLWGIEMEEVEIRAKQFHIPKHTQVYKVKKEAEAALKQLSTTYDLFIVTARTRNLVDITNEWIDKHFKGVFKDTHFVPIWEPGNKVTKTDICRQIGASYLIDDLPSHCNVAAEGGISAILFGDYAWNRNEAIVKGVTRCKNWDEVFSYLGHKPKTSKLTKS